MKSEPHFPDDVARIARILADPVRLHLLTIIARAREISCAHLLDHADVGASTVSYHVKMLTQAGLVTVVIDGRHRNVRFERETLRRFTEIVAPSPERDTTQRAPLAALRNQPSEDGEPRASSPGQGHQ